MERLAHYSIQFVRGFDKRRGQSSSSIVKANRKAMTNYKNTSPYDLISALAAVQENEHSGNAWSAVVAKTMGKYRLAIRALSLSQTDPAVELLVGKFQIALTPKQVSEALRHATGLLNKQQRENRSFFERETEAQEKPESPISIAAIVGIIDQVEDILRTILTQAISEVDEAQLQQEVNIVSTANRLSIMGQVTQVLSEAVIAYESPQEIAKAAIAITGVFLPKLILARSEEVAALLPEDGPKIEEVLNEREVV